MQENYTAVIKQSGPWWIGWIEEVPGVNCQEITKEALLQSLRETLREALARKICKDLGVPPVKRHRPYAPAHPHHSITIPPYATRPQR